MEIKKKPKNFKPKMTGRELGSDLVFVNPCIEI